jgi:hypothetical protein
MSRPVSSDVIWKSHFKRFPASRVFYNVEGASLHGAQFPYGECHGRIGIVTNRNNYELRVYINFRGERFGDDLHVRLTSCGMRLIRK